MKPIIFAAIGVILYAIQNAVIDVKLKSYSTVSLLLGFYFVLFPLALGLFLYQKNFGQGLTTPSGNVWPLMIAVATMFFVADFFYIGAYTSGGNVVSVTTIFVMMPVIGALAKFLWTKEAPSLLHCAGFLCAACAVIFVTVGDLKKAPPQTKTLTEEKV